MFIVRNLWPRASKAREEVDIAAQWASTAGTTVTVRATPSSRRVMEFLHHYTATTHLSSGRGSESGGLWQTTVLCSAFGSSFGGTSRHHTTSLWARVNSKRLIARDLCSFCFLHGHLQCERVVQDHKSRIALAGKPNHASPTTPLSTR